MTLLQNSNCCVLNLVWMKLLEMMGNICSRFLTSTVSVTKKWSLKFQKRLVPVFLGELPEALEWADTLGIEPTFDKIAVWATEGKHVYLQFIWEDGDCPIVISLGAG